MTGSKSEIEELQQDVEEARNLLTSITRRRWKDIITTELFKIEAKIKNLEVSSENYGKSSASSPFAVAPRAYTTIIRNYSWDQSDKFLKLYLSLNGVENLDKEKIVCTFEKKALAFKVLELDGKNHELNIANLAYAIVPDKSYFKVKTDMVVVFAAKLKSTTWEAVTAEEKRILDTKKASKPDVGKEDPTSGLMGLMKQMYDDGDDEMKRMLNKSWYESQQKSKGDLSGDLPGLGNLNI